MTQRLRRALAHATLSLTILVGADCAVFFSAAGNVSQVLILPVPVALAVVETVSVVQNHLPVALAKAVIVPKAPRAVVAGVSRTVVAPSAASIKPEARLIIPSVAVDAVIKEMGYTPTGAMAVPGNRIDVGWFEPGTVPGKAGSAVIGGHNRWDGGDGVFIRLDQLKIGDTLTVIDKEGLSTTFVVRGMKTFDAADPDSGIFESLSGEHLNLITCSGVWDPATQSYTTRLVIFTDAV